MKLALPTPSRPTGDFQDSRLGPPVLMPKWQLVNRNLAALDLPPDPQLPAAQQVVQNATWSASLNQRVLAGALTGEP